MKSVIVTGAGGGMGREICAMLTDGGYRVYGIDRGEYTAKCYRACSCDLTDGEAVSGTVKSSGEDAGEIFAVVHTAGIYRLNSLVEMSEDEFTGIFDVNLGGVFRVNREVVKYMSRGSRIVITTSELAPLDPLPFTGIYGITKSALEKYAYSLRMELNLLGISVSVLRPGAVKTSLLGDSTREMDRFITNTEIYKCNAKRFGDIVNRVEARCVEPRKIAKIVTRALGSKRPRLLYCINRNPLLMLLSALPDRLQLWIIGLILK